MHVGWDGKCECNPPSDSRPVSSSVASVTASVLSSGIWCSLVPLVQKTWGLESLRLSRTSLRHVLRPTYHRPLYLFRTFAVMKQCAAALLGQCLAFAGFNATWTHRPLQPSVVYIQPSRSPRPVFYRKNKHIYKNINHRALLCLFISSPLVWDLLSVTISSIAVTCHYDSFAISYISAILLDLCQ